jgi:hypothetical protein
MPRDWLGWAQIEIRRYGDALQTLNDAVYEQKMQPERAMVRAVANWQAQGHDEAMRDFDIALGGRPEWGNSNWVKALYPPLVAQSIQEMQAERERRKQKVRAAASRSAEERVEIRACRSRPYLPCSTR